MVKCGKCGKSKSRNWCTIVYPDSASNDWENCLSSLHVPAFVSPIHDKDIDATGEVKKPHYHVILMFDGPRTQDYVRSCVETFGGVGVENVQSLRGMTRYLCHLDDKDKAQYNVSDITCYGGADYESLLGDVDTMSVIGEIITWCTTVECTSFARLLRFAQNNNKTWFRVLCTASNCTVIYRFLRSFEYDLAFSDARRAARQGEGENLRKMRRAQLQSYKNKMLDDSDNI